MKKNWILVQLLLVISIGRLSAQELKIDGVKMAVRMANSEIKQFPDPWTVDFNPKPVWNYTQGLIAQSMVRLWKVTHQQNYYAYAEKYAIHFIDSAGSILGYKPDEHNIDAVNSGKFLFDIYGTSKDERYLKAIKFLRDQLKEQPRTQEGGFWHKLRYPNQMWLDGLYMGTPFYAQYAAKFNETAAFDDVVNQFVTVHKHTYNATIGLNYHGWDESKVQKWADPQTGCSPNFWSRAEGWYAMALVDVLDFLPQDHPGRAQLLDILKQVAAGIKKWQDPSTGLWYQVLDQGNRQGNYFEASGSSMFVYALFKAVRKGYIGQEYKETAVKGYYGIVKKLIRENNDGTISLTGCCSVAGLGGTPYRSGTYEYYIGEPVRDNDPKGVGPFIMASLEYNQYVSISMSPFSDSRNHWYGIKDDGNIVNPVVNQPVYPESEIIKIANNVLLYQRNNGGWPKNYDMQAILTGEQIGKLIKAKDQQHTTFDNSTTYTHVEYLAQVYTKTSIEKYKDACLRGLKFILKAQYPNGGWPQYYPLETKNYSSHITFNDGAYIGVMETLKKINDNDPMFAFIGNDMRKAVKNAFDKGLECILKCQIVSNGRLTAWCQQHNEFDLKPAWARAYEMPSICNGESAQIVLFLMSLDHPDKRVIGAIQSAVIWFNDSKIYNTDVKTVPAPPEKSQWRTSTIDKIVVVDSTAPPIWTRYYELETERPLFSDRNSKMLYSLTEVSRERRSGYSWYTYAPQTALDKYPVWQKKWATEKNVLEK
jgi:unsaturated rhamnogalacturonyl hydrolase